jgi:hypothetical protein
MPTQRTNIYHTTADGIDFSANPQTWKISAHVHVSSTKADGVASSFNNSTLFNSGRIFGGVDGVHFDHGKGTIVNRTSGKISGFDRGIFVDGNHQAITNNGSITSHYVGVLFDIGSNHVKLTNDGSIFCRANGIVAASNHEGGNIINQGSIQSDGNGVSVITNLGFTTTISNDATGIIEGKTDAIAAIDGAISLNNHGTIIGNIDCMGPGANDHIVNHGKINGIVKLDGGNDVFNGTGGTSGGIFAGSHCRQR